MIGPAAARNYFEGSQPTLRVENMATSVRFYGERLGFKNAEWGTEEFTSVNRDRAGIDLCQRNQGQGKAWIWVGLDDVGKLHKEYLSRDVALKCLPPMTLGLLRCTLRIPMATQSASALSLSGKADRGEIP